MGGDNTIKRKGRCTMSNGGKETAMVALQGKLPRGSLFTLQDGASQKAGTEASILKDLFSPTSDSTGVTRWWTLMNCGETG